MNDHATTGTSSHNRPKLSNEGLPPTHSVDAVDEYGLSRTLRVAGEFPLTIQVDGAEIVTLMSLGTFPEKLTLGYLRNQHLINEIGEIAEVRVDWEREVADVRTTHGNGIVNLKKETSNSLDPPYEVLLPQVKIKDWKSSTLSRTLAATTLPMQLQVRCGWKTLTVTTSGSTPLAD